MTIDSNRQPWLTAHQLSKTYRSRRLLPGAGGRIVNALCEVSLSVAPGARLGIVGESGCGKSTLARCLAGLEVPDSGEIQLHPELNQARQRVQLIQQDAVTALNPRFSLEEILAEPLVIARASADFRTQRVREALSLVGLPSAWLERRPSELSGGQRQRVAVARALCVEPRVLILDEALSGLDLPVQDEMRTLFSNLQSEKGIGYVFISHDLRMVAHWSDEIAVMDQGRIVEYATPELLFRSPRNASTQELIRAIPEWYAS